MPLVDNVGTVRLNEKYKHDMGTKWKDLPKKYRLKMSTVQSMQSPITSLSEFMRNPIILMQFFVNAYMIEYGQRQIPVYLYSQSFWYSIAQLVMNISVTNTNPYMPDNFYEFWNQFRERHPAIVFPRNNFTGYRDALSAACKTLREFVDSSSIGFECLFQTYLKRLQEGIAGEKPVWSSCLENASFDLFLAIGNLRDFTFPLMPQRCTLETLSERPAMYEQEHQQSDDEESGNLPRLISIAPQPSFHFRFVTINAKALKALVQVRNHSDDYEGNLKIFNQVFDLDKYGFRSLRQLSLNCKILPLRTSTDTVVCVGWTLACGIYILRHMVLAKQEYEIRRCSSAEYYGMTGSPERGQQLLKHKRYQGIDTIDSNLPSAKTCDIRKYNGRVDYFFLHKDALFQFLRVQMTEKGGSATVKAGNERRKSWQIF
ncbi:hypothetical protein EC973_007737 [Apophysomyces ossiformis]|uniref:Uncharacterized protein n=1 Tax=Apophysomyces ossiformis TaxID=679940 RepID=A0A8H7BZ85_9FUNG|nr:hypothetical protein EC973_007737 [Apophysomyces ossiformis]